MKSKSFIAAFLLLVWLFSCATVTYAQVTLSDTDYAKAENWLYLGGDGSLPVDIFAVYPTVTFSQEKEDQPFVRLDSPMMRSAAQGWAQEMEALLACGNMYVPLYRQLSGVTLGTLDSAQVMEHTNALPREDVFAALDYFLTEINKGERPFVLFGHSQGGKLVTEAASLLLGDPAYAAYADKHVATYAIGASVLESDLARNPGLAFAQSATDIGVVLSWNTTSPSEISSGAYKGFATWQEGALTINPISWTQEELLAHSGDNRASLVLDPEKGPMMVEHYANAIVDKEHGVLVVYNVDEGAYESFSSLTSKYHRFDIPFFYESIRQNIKDRVDAYFAAHP